MSEAKERTNRHRLQPLAVSINFESTETMTKFNLPRRYTWVAHHVTIGREYNKKLIDKVAKEETQVIGEWIEHKEKHEIRLEVLLSTDQNQNVEARDNFFKDKLGIVLEEIAFAETALLKAHPSLASTKIRIHFKAKDPKHERTDYWHRLGHWTSESMKDTSVSEVTSPKKEKSSKKHDKYASRRPGSKVRGLDEDIERPPHRRH